VDTHSLLLVAAAVASGALCFLTAAVHHLAKEMKKANKQVLRIRKTQQTLCDVLDRVVDLHNTAANCFHQDLQAIQQTIHALVQSNIENTNGGNSGGSL